MRIGYTIILNGLHHLKHNNYGVDLLENHLDYWVVVEGASNNRGSTWWCKPAISSYHNKGFSIDGTTEYLKELSLKYNNLIYIQPKGVWNSKDDMVNRAIDEVKKITNKCFLWQIDIDEQMTVDQRIDSEHELLSRGGKTGMFYINQYVGKNLIANGDWVTPFVRLWDWKGEHFETHESPKLVGGNGNVITLNQYIEHYSFYFEQDIKFKNEWYNNHKGLYKNWLNLQKETQFPQDISRLFDNFGYGVKTIIDKKRKLNVNNLYFYNNFHNGDVHYSQEFVKDISSQIQYNNCYYLHNNNKKLLRHIPYLKQSKITDSCRSQDHFYWIENDLYINTWIGCEHFKHLKHGCSLYSNYDKYKYIYDDLKLDLKNIEYYIPTIDYKYYDIENINEFLKENKKFKVLICNGNALSNQADNINMDTFINKLSDKYKDITFILTDKKHPIKKSNIVYTKDVVNVNYNDLNEISYLSNYCDIIIGKCSGPYCFTHVKRNFYSNKIFIGLCKNEKETIWYDTNTVDIFNINNLDEIDVIEKIIEYKITLNVDSHATVLNDIKKYMVSSKSVTSDNNKDKYDDIKIKQENVKTLKSICEEVLLNDNFIIKKDNVIIFNSLTKSKDILKFEDDYFTIKNKKYEYRSTIIEKIK
jgi:hypothetical protein